MMDFISEADIQNAIRLQLNDFGTYFRANVGAGWVGTVVKKGKELLQLTNYRRLSTGLPTGFSDLFGMTSVTVTQEMVGTQVAVFTALEVKSAKGFISREQTAFIDMVKRNGGIAGIVRSYGDVQALIKNYTKKSIAK